MLTIVEEVELEIVIVSLSAVLGHLPHGPPACPPGSGFSVSLQTHH